MSSTHERAIKSYLPPLYSKLTKNMAKLTGQSASSIVVDAVKNKFDNMAPQDRERILKSEKK